MKKALMQRIKAFVVARDSENANRLIKEIEMFYDVKL